MGYQKGDYARLYGNGGSGEIDYDNPLTNEFFDLFLNGVGIYGCYETPCYDTPCYEPWASGGGGCYTQPCYVSPCYYTTTIISVSVDVAFCGDYKFALKVFDKLGNENAGTPEEVEVNVHTAPPPPTGLKKNSYNSTTDILVLDAA